MIQRIFPVLGGLIVGVAIGIFVAGQLTGNDDEPLPGATPEVGARKSELESRRDAGVSRVPREAQETGPTEKPGDPAGADSDQLIGPALEGHARAGIARGWAAQRQDEIPADLLETGFESFVAAVLALPEVIGARLASERTEAEARAEAIAGGDARSLLLSCHEKSEAPPWEILEDAKRLDEFFRPRNPEKLVSLDPDPRAMAEELVDGATLEFGAGVFDLGPFVQGLRLTRGRDLSDITIRGAGMDNTLLVLSGELSPGGHLERLRISDCTIHCNDHYLFDQRRGVVALDCERVRIVGFDMGAGGSSMFNARQGLATMKHCQILGGYSRAAVGFGNLYDVRSDGNGSRYEGCLIKQITIGGHLRGHHVFVNCQLEEILDRKQRFEAHAGIRLVGTTVSYFARRDPQTRQGRKVQHDLNDLFPNWQARMTGR